MREYISSKVYKKALWFVNKFKVLNKITTVIRNIMNIKNCQNVPEINKNVLKQPVWMWSYVYEWIYAFIYLTGTANYYSIVSR